MTVDSQRLVDYLALLTQVEKQDVMNSVDNGITQYEATGLHITLEEFMGWTQAVQSHRDATPPACHV